MATMTVNGPNVKIKNRSRISRNEAKNTVTITFDDGTRRRYTWGAKVSIKETSERNAYRRNSLRRNGYPNYFEVLEEQHGC